jgi:hypothetical protein
MTEEIENLRKISEIINITCSIYLISFGLLSNIISFIIYRRKIFRKQSIGTYLSWVSISNLIAILTLLKNLFNNFEWTKSNLYCKFYVYLHYINLQYCSWILVINSFDHLFSVTMAFKYKIKILQKKNSQIFILLGVLASLLLINIPLLLNSFYNKKINGCDIYANLAYLIDILDMLVATMIPFMLMIFSTSVILAKLFKWKQTTRFPNDTRRSLRKTSFARTVIGINLLFLVCNLPISIVLIIINYNNAAESDVDEFYGAKLDLLYTIFHMLMYSHNASPLIVNLLCNKIFRKEFLILFCVYKDRNLSKNKITR